MEKVIALLENISIRADWDQNIQEARLVKDMSEASGAVLTYVKTKKIAVVSSRD